MASDGHVLCAAARWAPGGRPLAEVVRDGGGGGGGLAMPAVLRIVRGSCGGLGVPSLPHPTLQPTVMLVSAGRRRQIIAQAVKLRPGRGPVAVGPRLSIPETYAGWFELLSEEGRAGRCVESVAELSRRPCPCLVREPLRAILAKESADAADGTAAHAIQAGDSSRTLAVGETISPGEEVSLPGGSNHPRGRYLTCATSRGDTVLLSLEQRGRFSPLAKEHNISGAHTARTLLAKRLPLTVRLVHGPPPRPARPLTRPRKAAVGHFTPDLPLRLLAAYEEEQVFAYPLQKENSSLVAVPLSASLKVLRTRNEDALRALPEFARVAEKCTRLLAEVQDRIHVIDAKAATSAASASSPSLSAASATSSEAVSAKTWRGVPFLRRSASSDAANLLSSPRHHQDENRAPALATASSSPRLSAAATTPDEYDEIDQIYDYVRGFAPLPKSLVNPAPTRTSSPPSPGSQPPSSPNANPPGAPASTKPEPPPIETIPSKKIGSSGRVHGHALNGGLSHGHLLLQEHHGHHHHHHHGHQGYQGHHPQPQQKAEKRSRHKESKGTRLYLKHLPANGTGSPASPMGQSTRYKSLSNIHAAMELEPAAVSNALAASPATTPSPVPGAGAAGVAGAGAVGTLDSSHSGGRTSGDSGPGNKLPEKRSRKLSRPRSLTNLVWEIRGGAPTAAAAPLEPHRSKLSLTGHKRLGTLYL